VPRVLDRVTFGEEKDGVGRGREKEERDDRPDTYAPSCLGKEAQ